MAQVNQVTTITVSNERRTQLRLGVWIELITIFWMTIEATIAILTGYTTRSISLQAFGIDSIIELIAGGVLLWRLLIEQRAGRVEALSVQSVALLGSPLLRQGKLHIAKGIGSAALKGDAACSVTCAYMSFALLAGLLLNRLFGWWRADPLAAIALVFFIVHEGREALQEARTGETCRCGEED